MYFGWMWLAAWLFFGRSADAFDMMGFAVIIYTIATAVSGARRLWREARATA
jgi:hypothetical protein